MFEVLPWQKASIWGIELKMVEEVRAHGKDGAVDRTSLATNNQRIPSLNQYIQGFAHCNQPEERGRQLAELKRYALTGRT